jgi:hypothetical protein
MLKWLSPHERQDWRNSNSIQPPPPKKEEEEEEEEEEDEERRGMNCLYKSSIVSFILSSLHISPSKDSNLIACNKEKRVNARKQKKKTKKEVSWRHGAT